MNLCVCPEAGITFTAHIVRFHPPFCCDPYCCNPPWQLKAVRGWFSVYRSQNVCQTFLTLHHSLGELHQPHSIFRPNDSCPSNDLPICELDSSFGFPMTRLTPPSGSDRMFVPQRKWGTPARQINATHVKLKRICDIQMKLEINHNLVKLYVHCEINETIEMTFKIETKLDTWNINCKFKKNFWKKKKFWKIIFENFFWKQIFFKNNFSKFFFFF